MNTPRVDLALSRLHRQWWAISLVCGLSLGLGYILLAASWQPAAARCWVLLSGCVMAVELVFLWRWLPDNSRQPGQPLLPALGLGNLLTIGRGLLVGLLAGFVGLGWPPGWLACLPAGLYSLAAVGDSLDGYVSRKTHYTTHLGQRLDMQVDALGLLVATGLAVAVWSAARLVPGAGACPTMALNWAGGGADDGENRSTACHREPPEP